MSERTRFNLIVATRERADTLLHCLRGLIRQDYDRLTIIVSDNFSQDHTRAVVESVRDPRIRYVNTGRRVGMSNNYEFALGHVSEGWVTYLGDDDGLLPGALRRLDELIREYQVEAVSPTFAYFVWPHHFPEQPEGSLRIPLTRSVTVKSSREQLHRVLQGRLRYTRLPWLYHGGGASLAAINRARGPDGRFFRSMIPDLYSSIALSLVTERYLSIDAPIAVNGASRHSIGTSLMGSKRDQAQSAFEQFRDEGTIPFHPSLIIGRSLQVMTYECYLQSSHLHNNEFGIGLDQQLRLGVQVAPLEDVAAVREQCRAIAEKNGLPYDPGKQGWTVHKLRRAPVVLREMLWSVVVVPTRLDIDTVDDASRAAGAIYAYLWSTPPLAFWCLRMLNFGRRVYSMVRAQWTVMRRPR